MFLIYVQVENKIQLLLCRKLRTELQITLLLRLTVGLFDVYFCILVS